MPYGFTGKQKELESLSLISRKGCIMEEKKLLVDVIVPVYKPKKKLKHLLAMLAVQTYPVHQVILINTEKQYWNEDEMSAAIPDNLNVSVSHISKQEFDHGATRHLGMEMSKGHIAVCMTDDAVPADKELISRLVRAFRQTGPDGETVIEVYARQLPDKDCSFTERYTRSFNYPETSRIKTAKDLEALGIKTFFASNVCCAYRRDLYFRQGGFIRKTIFNEDMIFAGKAIQDGYAIAYAADAKVIHSHNYTGIQQFKRNFDLAVSQADHPEIFNGIRSESEGIRLVKTTAGYLIKKGKVWLLPDLVVKSGFKYLGYRMGKRYKKLPKAVVLRCTMNPGYWDERGEERI